MEDVKRKSRIASWATISAEAKQSGIHKLFGINICYESETWCFGQNEIGILLIRKSIGESCVWFEVGGQKKDRRSNADVRLGIYNGSAGKMKCCPLVLSSILRMDKNVFKKYWILGLLLQAREAAKESDD